MGRRSTSNRRAVAGEAEVVSRKSRASPRGGERRARQFAIEAARLLHERHCSDVLILDVRGRSDVTDYVLLASGTSERQIRAVGQEVEELAEERGLTVLGREEDVRATWVVLDFIDVVVHLFEPATRAHYDLEMMWGDAPRVNWRKRTRRQRAGG